MDLDATALLQVPVAPVFAALSDLATYPAWLSIVDRAVPAPAHEADAGDPAWVVDLVGRVGPLSRRKRVRMVRTGHDPDDRGGGAVRFERREHDGRDHNTWILTGRAEPGAADPATTEVALHIHYGGGARLFGADRLLRQEVQRAGARLQAHLRG